MDYYVGRNKQWALHVLTGKELKDSPMKAKEQNRIVPCHLWERGEIVMSAKSLPKKKKNLRSGDGGAHL